MGERFYTVTEAARRIGISGAALRHRLAVGLLPGVKAGPRAWVIRESDIEHARKIGRLRSGPKPNRIHAAS